MLLYSLFARASLRTLPCIGPEGFDRRGGKLLGVDSFLLSFFLRPNNPRSSCLGVEVEFGWP